jgi:PPOX class probable F420-dependent enzyme
MTAAIPDAYRDLLDKPAIAHLATLMPDGTPQVTPVWCDFDGRHVRVNSAKGRRKDLNMRGDARVSLSLCDPDNAYRYLEIRGRVVDITEAGADAHIDALAAKYLGVDSYPNRREGEVRVIYRIAPAHFTHMG